MVKNFLIFYFFFFDCWELSPHWVIVRAPKQQQKFQERPHKQLCNQIICRHWRKAAAVAVFVISWNVNKKNEIKRNKTAWIFMEKKEYVILLKV